MTSQISDWELSWIDPVGYLVRVRFPILRPTATLLSRAGDSTFDARERQAKHSAIEYREELRALSVAELQHRVDIARQAEFDRKKEEARLGDKFRFFSQPEADVDFNHWARTSYWVMDEAVALSFGKDPRFVTWEKLASFIENSEFAAEYAKRRELVSRAQDTGQLLDSTPPRNFLAWAERMQFPMPAELVAAVESLGFQIADWKTLYDQQQKLVNDAVEKKKAAVGELKECQRLLADAKIRTDEQVEFAARQAARIEQLESKRGSQGESVGLRERDSLLKLIIGMALGGYAFDPKAKKGSAVLEIVSDLQLRGVALDAGTVRKYLAEAKDLLPASEAEQDR